MLKKWKNSLFLLSVFALLCLSGTLSYYFCNENVQFERFCNKLFRQEVSSDTLTLHYSLAHPKEYGIVNTTTSLPFYEKESATQNRQILTEYIDCLTEISSSKLSPDNQYTHALLLSYFRQLQQLEQYPYYESPFSPVNGVHSQLPILLSEYTFRCTDDIDDYLQILSDSGPYLSSLLTYQKEKTIAGLGSDDLSLTEAAGQCLALFSGEEIREGKHFLQTSFTQKLQELCQQNLLSTKEATQYIKKNNSLLLEVVYPAYQNLSAELLNLKKGDNSTPSGLCSYPKGKEYYQNLVRFQTGSDKNITEIKNSLETFLASFRLTLSKLITSSPDSLLLLEQAQETDWFPTDTETAMLTHLISCMENNFPDFPSEQRPDLILKEVSASLSATTAPAFYLTPPMDDCTSNVIYLNSQSQENPLTMYTTLAHEGYPGHLYQTVYYQQLANMQDLPLVRHVLHFEGYQEGWALYVEFASYDYLIELAAQRDYPKLSLGYEIEKHNRMMQLCLYSLLDIYIHYEGYSQSQITAYLASIGISDAAVCEQIYRYIANAPGNYLKYFWSYLEILTLKKNAMYLLKEDYTDLWFHQFYLDCGPSDFTSLANALVRKKSLRLPSAF